MSRTSRPVTHPAPEPGPLRCSFAADERADTLFGTAAHAEGFLLIEQPGAWGHNALAESELAPVIATHIAARAAELLYRVLLVKRPGRSVALPHRTWIMVDARPGAEQISEGTFTVDSELLELPFEHRSPERATAAPIYLVCTHGRHDACCALRGRPVAASLARQRPGRVWECSHIGGDRFAPNVLVLPEGLYYGRVRPEDASGIVVAYERSELVVELFRGRTAFRPAVQAAQHFARLDRGIAAIHDLEPLRSRTNPTGTIAVDLAYANGHVSVTVRPTFGPTAGLLTCRATHPLHPPSFALQDIRFFDR